MDDRWTGESLLAMGRSYQAACVLLAAAEANTAFAAAFLQEDKDRARVMYGWTAGSFEPLLMTSLSSFKPSSVWPPMSRTTWSSAW